MTASKEMSGWKNKSIRGSDCCGGQLDKRKQIACVWLTWITTDLLYLSIMEASDPLLRIAFRAHPQVRCIPSRSLRAVSKPQYQHRPLAHAAHKIAASMSSTNESTVMDAIKHDHAELKEYYNNILSAEDNDSKIRWQNQFVWELARHSIGEELVVYPAMEKHMGPEGKEMADKDRTEHNKVSGLLQHVDFVICGLCGNLDF